MAPRAKKKAKRQLGTPSFDSDRFWRMEAETQFDDVWCHKPVVVERFWKINEFHGEEFLLLQNFEGRHWLSIAQFQAFCISDLVREFFANIKETSINRRIGREKLIGWVRGVEIQLTPDDFASVFQLPRVANPEFSYPAEGGPPLHVIANEVLTDNQEWTSEHRKAVSALKAKYWALHMFSCTNLLPQNRNSDCSPTRARLIYAIGTGMTIDLPSFIWHQIASTFEHQGGQSSIPFGGALTEIFRRKGAQIPTDSLTAPTLQPLAIVSYVKSRGNLEKGKKKRPVDATMGEGSGSHRPWDEEDEAEVSIADLVVQMNRLEHNQHVDHGVIMAMQQEQKRQTHLLQTILDHLHDSHQPPPSL